MFPELLYARGRRRTTSPADVRFALLLLGFVCYAGLFILRTSFVVDGERYFSLFDDAMISMRYARNLARGYGLVWNPGGERIEGYTNPLWVFFMAGIHLLPIALSKTSLAVQAAAAALLAANLVVVRRIALEISGGSEPVAVGAVVLTAWYLPLDNWSLQGMEVSVLVLVVSFALRACARLLDDSSDRRGRESRDTRLPWLYVLLGVSTWVRPDMAVTVVGLVAFMAAADRRDRRRHLLWGASALAAGVVSQTLFRLWYFGAPLPNTYYLKMTGYPAALRMARGLYVLAQFLWTMNPLLVIVAAWSAARGSQRRWLLAWILMVQAAYSVYVGGDAWEYWGGANRYIAISMPAFFVLLADGLFEIAQYAARAVAPVRAFAALVAVALVSVNCIHGPGALEELLLIQPALHSGPGDENAREAQGALALRGATSADATLAVTRAGTLPYFSDRPSIDLLGKTDRHLAAEASRVLPGIRHFRDFRPGHTKYDDGYSIGVLKPDVIAQLWGPFDEAAPYMRDYRRVQLGPDCAYVRTDSPRVNLATLHPCGLP